MKINKENLAKFFDRKGFYIVLFLCIVVVGVTAVYVTNNNLKKMAELKTQQEELNSANNEANIGAYTTENPKDVAANTAGSTQNITQKSTAENNNAVKVIKEKTKSTSGEKSVPSAASVQSRTSESSNADVQTIAQNTTSGKNTTSNATLVLIKPVDGDIIMEFAKDKLTYSKTLDEWTTHNGVDIKASSGTAVVAAMDGVVSKIYKDDKLGNTVVIKSGKYETRYANLEDGISVKQGDKITKGQEIGKVGSSARFEIAEDAHVHFELLKDGVYLDPALYFQ